jgi:predicted enzyme related to lactoylglutathione lyase
MHRHYDHVDLRVPQLARVTSFYERLLPALGFTREVRVEGWLQFEAAGADISEFFGVTESRGHVANENPIAFWAESASEVDRLAEVARHAGAHNIEGPMQYERGYYAVFFEDPCGNRLEVCYRTGHESTPPLDHEPTKSVAAHDQTMPIAPMGDLNGHDMRATLQDGDTPVSARSWPGKSTKS